VSTIPDIVEELKELESPTIRGTIGMPEIVRYQIILCNRARGGEDPAVFEAHVRALLDMLPQYKRDEIQKRESEYIYETERWQYRYWCGIPLGTPENPITSDGEPPKPDWSNVVSPTLVREEVVDYEKLFSIIMETLEGLGLSWAIDQKTVEHGKAKKEKIPKHIIKTAAEAVVNVVLDARKRLIEDAKNKLTGADLLEAVNRANQLSYIDIVEALRRETPPTPVIESASRWMTIVKSGK